MNQTANGLNSDLHNATTADYGYGFAVYDNRDQNLLVSQRVVNLGNGSVLVTQFGGNQSSNADELAQSGVGGGAWLPSAAKIVAASAVILVIVSCIVGNSLVICSIVCHRPMRKRKNFLYVSLAVADILVGTCVMTIALTNDLLGYWPFGSAFCHVWISLDVMCSTASIVNISAIAFDRYMRVRSPFAYERWLTRAKMGLIIIAVWVLSIGISFIPIQFGWHLSDPGEKVGLNGSDSECYTSSQCSLDEERNGKVISVNNETQSSENQMQCKFSVNATYAIASSCVSFFVPGFCLVLVYGRLHQIARSHYDAIKQNTVPLSPQSQSQLLQTQEQQQHSHRRVKNTLSDPSNGKRRADSQNLLINGSTEMVDRQNPGLQQELDPEPETDLAANHSPHRRTATFSVASSVSRTPKITNTSSNHYSNSSNSSNNNYMNNFSKNHNHGKFFHERKATITLGFLIGAFLTCWSPFFSINVLAPFCSSCISDFSFTLVTYLGYSNSALDPVAIFLTNNDFRRSLRRMVTLTRFW